MTNSPILLFTYNRLVETKKTIEALQRNTAAANSELYIFSDAPKSQSAAESVAAVREYLSSIDGFKNVTIIERPQNFGLAKSIITGVTEIIEKYDRVIVLEDDLLTSTNFISFMNQALDLYESNSKVWNISGFSFPIQYKDGYNHDASIGVRASSWGWATWKDRWKKVDWQVSDYDNFRNDKKAQKEFKHGGSDLCKMLHDQMTGKINSWAIRFVYAQFKNKAFDIFPTISKIQNIGFSGDATHTDGMDKRFKTQLDRSEKTTFSFPKSIELDYMVLKQFRKPFSILVRLQYKILGLFK